MEKTAIERVSAQLADASRQVATASSSHEVKQCLVGTVRLLQEAISRIENSPAPDGAWTQAHALHARALEDFDKLDAKLSAVATTLADEGRFVWMLNHKGSDRDAYRAYASTVGSLDSALQHLVHLMQFDAEERNEVDVRDGFTFTSGSVSYGRMQF